MPILSGISLCILVIFVVAFQCKFLSIKTVDEDHFTFVGTYDLISFLLKSSLEDIVMNNNVEIIISSSKHVKMSKEIIIPTEKSHHDTHVDSIKSIPQWRIIDLIYRDTFEGIHLSRQTDHNQGYHLSIHSLSFEIDDPIQFSTDINWSAQVDDSTKHGSVAFSDSTPQKLHKIIQILFKKNLEIKFFRNSSLISKEESTFYSYTRKINPQSDFLSLIDLLNVYYMVIKENNQTIYFSKNDETIPLKTLKFERNCLVNSSASYNLIDSISSLKRSIEEMSLSSDRYAVQVTNNLLSQEFGIMNDSSIFLELSEITPEIFLEITEKIIEELFFKMSVNDIPIIIFYHKKSVVIKYENGAFALALSEYFSNLLKSREIINIDHRSFDNIDNVIKICDQNGNILSFNINNSISFRDVPIPPLTSRVILFHGRVFIYDAILERNPAFDKINSEYRQIEQSKITRAIRALRKRIDREFPMILHGNNDNNDNNDNNNSNQSTGIGMEIIFNHDNHTASINVLISRSPRIQIKKPSLYIPRFYYRWKLFMINVKSKVVIGEKFTNSHEFPIYFWRTIDSNENFVMSIQKIFVPCSYDEPHPSVIYIDLDRVDWKSRLKMVKLLFEQEPHYEIREFRLKHKFKIEIDLIDSSNDSINKFIKSICKRLKLEKINYKIEKYSKSQEITRRNTMIIPRPSEAKKSNIKENLSWKEAIKLLFKEEPSTHSMVQLIERKGNHLFSGNISIIYYKKPIKFKDRIKICNHKEQIVRMGKLDHHKDINFSFIFVQYAINENKENENRCYCYKDHLVWSFDLTMISSINEIIQKIIKNFLDISNSGRIPWMID